MYHGCSFIWGLIMVIYVCQRNEVTGSKFLYFVSVTDIKEPSVFLHLSYTECLEINATKFNNRYLRQIYGTHIFYFCDVTPFFGLTAPWKLLLKIIFIMEPKMRHYHRGFKIWQFRYFYSLWRLLLLRHCFIDIMLVGLGPLTQFFLRMDVVISIC